MPANLENLGFGTEWVDFKTDSYEGYLPNMSDYHMHAYYEISLILSGSVKILLPDAAQTGMQSRLVLTPPMTSHLIVCEPHILYRRINLLFSPDFLTVHDSEWKNLLGVFGRNGRVVPLSNAGLADFLHLAQEMQCESDRFRLRLWLMLFLSKISSHVKEEGDGTATELPAFVTEALSYLQEHHAEKIVAADLAWRLGVGRTTLMTAFKKYTGSTLNEYLTSCRLKHAITLLRCGNTRQSTAEACGFGDACNMIRSFRQRFGMTPGEYLQKEGTSTFI